MEKIWVDANERFFNVAATVMHKGVTYNGNVLSFPDVVAELGLHEVELAPLPLDYSTDTHYLTMQDSDPYRVVTRKSDEQIAQFKQSVINTQALDYLAKTDWYVNRFAETGVVIPDAIKAARQAARDSVVHLEVGNEITA